MTRPDYTDEQNAAIETVDRSVVVTAAAGAGKTTVLAGRCAHLVCDLPPSKRCSVEQMLVVTFTEAAASEMRSRIHKVIRERLADRPHDGWLRTQLALIDTAQISTVHAFCLWVVRRWFHLVGVDPIAAVFDEDEARLAQTETLEALFAERYEAEGDAGDAFRRLVGDYGLGRDEGIAEFVLKLSAFANSLPDPEAWLREALRRVGDASDVPIAELHDRLQEELALQETECRQLAEYILAELPPGESYADRIDQYVRQLSAWRTEAQNSGFDAVQNQINAFELSSGGAGRMAKDDPDRPMRDLARDIFEDVRGRLFKKRLRRRFARFSRPELTDGLRAIAPYVETIFDLVREFDRRYTSAKLAAGALDFADLERYAYRLLSRPEGEVAGVLRRRFAHVLVDEYQDINPLQEAILRLASREPEAGSTGNLFTVGDVKQSIYRFRLAEPQVLIDRETAFDRKDSPGLCVRLQENYRSRKRILDGVNLLFSPLMRREIGGIAYDEKAKLRFGNEELDPKDDVPVELHLLERKITVENDEENGDGQPRQPSEPGPQYVDLSDPAQWTQVEREAFLIGTRIRHLLASGVTVEDGRPLRLGDVAVLTRVASNVAAPMAEMFGKMGIAAYADARGTLFETVEVRDVLALLNVLDNRQQDIPLASVMRSGVLGERFDEDDLASVRLVHRGVPFHEAVRLYETKGNNEDLRQRVESFLRTLARCRADIRQRPLADVLWHVYEQTGYLARVGGLRNGIQRRANLLKLHERARQFGTFQRQGLHRFLRFIEMLQNEQQDFGAAPAVGEAENVVRIMSIHRSKGLEFPVVFVVGLGRRFNLDDTRGRMIYDRHAGIGLRAVNREAMIEYPSVIHHLAAHGIEAASRAEELRLLYVAMTRAKERLILLGSLPLKAVERDRQRGQTGRQITPLRVAAANTPLDWIVPVLAGSSSQHVAWTDTGGGDPVMYRVTLHADLDIRNWRLDDAGDGPGATVPAAVAALAPLPASEPRGAFAEQADAVVARLDLAYPHLAESSIRAVVAASELKRAFDVLDDPDAQARERYRGPVELDVPSLADSDDAVVSAARRGTATHLLLQHLRFDAADDAATIRAEAARLVDVGTLATAEADGIDLASIAWFIDTPLGRRIRSAGPAFEREVMFLSAEPAEMFDRTLGPCDVPVVVRGVVDGVLADGDELELVDYKTDRIYAEQVTARAGEYAMQMRLYARAVARAWRRKVRKCWLVFLHPRAVVPVEEG